MHIYKLCLRLHGHKYYEVQTEEKVNVVARVWE